MDPTKLYHATEEKYFITLVESRNKMFTQRHTRKSKYYDM